MMSDSESEVEVIDLTQEAPGGPPQLDRTWPRSRTPWRGGGRQTTLGRAEAASTEPQPGTPTRPPLFRRGRRGHRSPFRGGPGYMRTPPAPTAPTTPTSPTRASSCSLAPCSPSDRQDLPATQSEPSAPTLTTTPPPLYRPLIPPASLEQLENAVIFDFLRQQFQEEAAGMAPGTFIAWKPTRIPLDFFSTPSWTAPELSEHPAGSDSLPAPGRGPPPPPPPASGTGGQEPRDADQNLPDPETAGLPPLLLPQNSDPGEPQV